MKKKVISKMAAALVAAAMAATAVAGCGSTETSGAAAESDSAAAAQEQAASGSSELTEGEQKYPEFITVDVFGGQSNYQGIQSGWFGKLVKDKFNMEFNVIAPNVAGGGDTLYQTRSANGNLGDLILTNLDKSRLKDLVQADLVLDMTDYMEGRENLSKYREAMEAASALAEEDGLWAIPSAVSEISPTEPCEVGDPTNAPSLRWDLYKEVGYPEMETLEDLLPVLKQMQDAAGTTESGKQIYALSLFKDWDGDLMQNAGAITALYGYDNPQGFASLNIVTGETDGVLDDDGIYVRALKFFFTANQMGLVDPESTTQNYDTLAAKYVDGAVLYSLWPWLGQGQYNSVGNTSEGRGFQSAVIKDARYLCWGSRGSGDATYGLMIGSKTKDPERMMDFVDWLYSPEGIEASGTDTNNICGPEGLTWELVDGKPVLTDFGVQVHIEKTADLQVPDEWGGGTYRDGISALNYSPLGIKDVNGENKVPYNVTLWDDYRERTSTVLSADWQEHYGTAQSPIDYFDEQGLICVVPGTTWASPEYSTDISAIKEQCRQTIVDYSWRMCFAESEEEFYALLKEMQDIAIGLGYNEVLAVDEANAAARYELFKEARGE